MSTRNAFERLKELVDDRKVTLSFKKPIDPFLLWTYCHSQFSKSLISTLLSGAVYLTYWLISRYWLGPLIAVLLALLLDVRFLVVIAVPFIVRVILRPIGFISLHLTAMAYEDAFDFLWSNGWVIISSTQKEHDIIRSSTLSDSLKEELLSVRPADSPAFMFISGHHDWRHSILEDFESEPKRRKEQLEGAFKNL